MPNHPTTAYFQHVRQRPDRSIIRDEWIDLVVNYPDDEEVQADGRVRCWKRIPEADGRALRVVLLADRKTIHNAFFDRDFVEPSDESQIF